MMVEEIDRRIQGVLGKVNQYLPWIFAMIFVIVILFAMFAASPHREGVYPPDKTTLQYWEREAKLRKEIDLNLKETSELLARLSVEMENADYNADTLLAQIKSKRRELNDLTQQLLDVRRKIEISSRLQNNRENL